MYKKLLLFIPSAVIGIFAYIIYIISFNFPEQVEMLYSRTIYPFFNILYSSVTSIFSFSLAEITVYLAIGVFLFFIVYIFISLFSKNKLYTFLKRICIFLTVISFLFSFYIFGWAINYARMPLADSLSLKVQDSSVEELNNLCLKLIDKANFLRENVNEDENGVFSLSDTRDSVNLYVKYIYIESDEYVLNLGGAANVKGVATTNFMSSINITGIYFPFTFEPNINMDMPDLLFPATACHEYAHFKGFAREDEANFIAYYVCRNSSNTDFAYSGTMLALIHSLNKLYNEDKDLYAKAYEKISIKIRRDLTAYSEYWDDFETKLAEIHESINDNYLKFNGQEDGIKSYGRMVDLLLALYRNNDI